MKRTDGSFRLNELTLEELVERMNTNPCAWSEPWMLAELCRRADCYYEEGSRIENLTIEQLDEIMYDLGYEPDDEGTYRHIAGMTDTEVDEWMQSIETGLARGEVIS